LTFSGISEKRLFYWIGVQFAPGAEEAASPWTRHQHGGHQSRGHSPHLDVAIKVFAAVDALAPVG